MNMEPNSCRIRQLVADIKEISNTKISRKQPKLELACWSIQSEHFGILEESLEIGNISPTS